MGTDRLLTTEELGLLGYTYNIALNGIYYYKNKKGSLEVEYNMYTNEFIYDKDIKLKTVKDLANLYAKKFEEEG